MRMRAPEQRSWRTGVPTVTGLPTSSFETLAYVWGCGVPSLPLFREGGADTEAARRVATARGWDAAREGAWAREFRLPARRATALLALNTEARRDPAVEDFVVP